MAETTRGQQHIDEEIAAAGATDEVNPNREAVDEISAIEADDGLTVLEGVAPAGLTDPGADGVIHDPTDLSSLGGGAGLPDLGVGDASAVDDLTNPGGSTLFDDLGDGASGGDVWDPLDDLPGADGSGGGWDSPINDQSGWAMDGGGGTDGQYPGSEPDFGADHFIGSAYWANDHNVWDEWEPGAAEESGAMAGGNAVIGATELLDDLTELSTEADQPLDSTDEDFDPPLSDDPPEQPRQGDSGPTTGGPRQGGGDEGSGDGPPSQEETTPIPFEVGGGSAGDGGGLGDDGEIDGSLGGAIDPEHGAGETTGGGTSDDGVDTVRAGTGAVDPAPEVDEDGDAGGLDLERAGLGAVDPVGDESTLLDDDGADSLTALGTQVEGDDLEIDGELVGDIGEDVG